jgi:hypothetical protein
VGPTGDLFECGHPILEVLVPNDRLQSGETEIELVGTDNTDRPLDVMVPELLMPVV